MGDRLTTAQAELGLRFLVPTVKAVMIFVKYIELNHVLRPAAGLSRLSIKHLQPPLLDSR